MSIVFPVIFKLILGVLSLWSHVVAWLCLLADFGSELNQFTCGKQINTECASVKMICIKLDYINCNFPLLELKVANVSFKVPDQVRRSARVSKDSMPGFKAPDGVTVGPTLRISCQLTAWPDFPLLIKNLAHHLGWKLPSHDRHLDREALIWANGTWFPKC